MRLLGGVDDVGYLVCASMRRMGRTSVVMVLERGDGMDARWC